MKKNIILSLISMVLITAVLSGCMEHRYYQKNHQHSKQYEQRHHRSTRPGVDIDIHH